jgi:hypothetical protein
MHKICMCRVKNCPIKNWLEKFMRKSYKYHKKYAEKLSSKRYSEKVSSNSCPEDVIHTYVISNFLKSGKSHEIFFRKGKSHTVGDRAPIHLLARAR